MPVSGAPAGERIDLSCPSAVGGLPTQPVDCPMYVLDQEDLFGQPDLAVDPRDPGVMAFSAMHGGAGLHPLPGDQPPSGRSRDASVHQPHTTFYTLNGAASWSDQPYYPPEAIEPASPLPGLPVQPGRARQAFGEDNAIALDGQGHAALAALYAYRDAASPAGAGSSAYQFAVALWREGRIAQGFAYDANVRVVELPAGLKADSLHLAYVPAADALVALWRQEDASNRSSVGGAWAQGKDAGVWTPLDANRTPQGCAAISRPFAEGARLLFACAPGHGAAPRVVALETGNWTGADLGALPLPDLPQVGLVPLEGTGQHAAWSAGVVDGRPRVVLTFGGSNETPWRRTLDIGADVARSDPAVGAPAEARITAAQYVPATGNLHLVYAERAAQAGSAARPGIAKAFVSVQAFGGLQARLDLGVGKVQRVDVSPTTTGVGEGVHDDLHDSLVLWTPPDGGAPREFLAYGDYGFVRFAEVHERDAAPPVVPLSVQVPPVPAASAGTLPALVGVPAGILAGAAMARVALARRKQTVEVRDE
jgi:hypothetical protein